MSVTSIEWTDRTWNPITGCTKVSPGCKNCYAEGVANRFWATQYRPVLADSGKSLDTISTSHHEDYLANGFARPRRFTDVMTHEDRLLEPLSWRKPAKVFVNSMSDLFHEDVPDAFIDRVWGTMARCPQHTFQILIKRADRMKAYFDKVVADGHALFGDGRYLPLVNVWLGTSCENQPTADERIPLLLQTPAAVRFISAEPLLGPVNLGRFFSEERQRVGNAINWHGAGMLWWVIVGGESGPGARPMDVAWARSIVQQCQAAGVACFVKQLGSVPVYRTGQPFNGEHQLHSNGAKLKDRKGGDPSEWPEDLRLREWPRVEVVS